MVKVGSRSGEGQCQGVKGGGHGRWGLGDGVRGAVGFSWGRFEMKENVLDIELIPFHSIPFHSIPIHSIPIRSIPFQSIPFHVLPYAYFGTDIQLMKQYLCVNFE